MKFLLNALWNLRAHRYTSIMFSFMCYVQKTIKSTNIPTSTKRWGYRVMIAPNRVCLLKTAYEVKTRYLIRTWRGNQTLREHEAKINLSLVSLIEHHAMKIYIWTNIGLWLVSLPDRFIPGVRALSINNEHKHRIILTSKLKSSTHVFTTFSANLSPNKLWFSTRRSAKSIYWLLVPC